MLESVVSILPSRRLRSALGPKNFLLRLRINVADPICKKPKKSDPEKTGPKNLFLLIFSL